jgi:pyrroloquinoline-quinone synthase
MATRVAAWEKHYAFVSRDVLEYFRARPTKAKRDSGEALAYVLANARSKDDEDRCVRALETKCEILWAMLDAISMERA